MLYSQDFIESSKSMMPNNISGGGEEGLKRNGTTKDDCKVEGKLLRKVNGPSTPCALQERILDTTNLKVLFLNPRKWLTWPHALGFEQYRSHTLPLSIGKHKWVFRSEGQKGNVLPSRKVQAL